MKAKVRIGVIALQPDEVYVPEGAEPVVVAETVDALDRLCREPGDSGAQAVLRAALDTLIAAGVVYILVDPTAEAMLADELKPTSEEAFMAVYSAVDGATVGYL